MTVEVIHWAEYASNPKVPNRQDGDVMAVNVVSELLDVFPIVVVKQRLSLPILEDYRQDFYHIDNMQS